MQSLEQRNELRQQLAEIKNSHEDKLVVQFLQHQMNQELQALLKASDPAQLTRLQGKAQAYRDAVDILQRPMPEKPGQPAA
jgi:isochorismate synthase EntC